MSVDCDDDPDGLGVTNGGGSGLDFFAGGGVIFDALGLSSDLRLPFPAAGLEVAIVRVGAGGAEKNPISSINTTAKPFSSKCDSFPRI